MATPQRLANPSITPSAQPVNTFLRFDANSQPAAPGKLPMLPQPKGIQSFQMAGTRDVQGVNALEELANALRPMSQLLDKGMELYATDQYQKGQNEILKAAANINRDTIFKANEYAKDNRQLSAENPIAGVLMDQANPFRQAGRTNQASQFVATLAPRLFQAEWTRNGNELSKLDPGSPALGATRASLSGKIAGIFGLDEFSPGFQKYVAPAIARSDEWLGQQQLKGHVKYQKDVGVKQASAVLTGLLFDPRTNAASWSDTLRQYGNQFGITGEPQQMIRKAIERTVGDLEVIKSDPDKRQQANQALLRLQGLPSGLVDENGLSLSVGQAYGREILSESAGIARDLKTLRDSRVQAATDRLQAELDANTNLTLTPEEAAAEAQRQIANPANADLTKLQILEVVSDNLEGAQELKELSFDTQSSEQFFEDASFAIGSDWDEGKFGARFREILQSAPRSLKEGLRKQWEALRNQKRKDANGEISSTEMSNGLKRASEAIVKQILPTKGPAMIRKANDLGMSVIDYLRASNPEQSSASQKARNYIQTKASEKIRKQTAELNRPLRPEEQSQIITDVMSETLANPSLMESFGLQKQEPAAAGDSDSTTAKPEPKTEVPTYYSTTQQVPEAVAKSGKPIYKRTDTIALLGAAANGSSLPANVKRAARANGMSTGQFLLKQAELLEIEVPPQMREKVERVARVEQGTSDTIASAAPSSSSPLSYASNALFNILTGSAPAVASTRPSSLPVELGPPAELGQFSRQVSSVTFDTGQPGIDVFFEDKKFPAVLGGRVKEVGYEGNANSGYGHFVVIESIDPTTGAPVDVLYSHFASKPSLNPGQQIQGGQIIGRQGGTGRVISDDGTIASIDFLAPAPAGSASKTPYSNFEQLRRSIAQQLRN